MTALGIPTVEVVGLVPDLAAKVVEIGQQALLALGASGPTVNFLLAVDDSANDGLPWYGLQGRGPEQVLVIYCSQSDFQEPQPLASALTSGVQVWEQLPPPAVSPTEDSHLFSESIAERFLYHQLVFAGDLLHGNIDTGLLPVSLNVAFQSAWSVTVDGRLEKWALPGYPLYLRRGIFSRLFAGSGILLPSHWHIFQTLWEGGLGTQNAVLEAVKQLPRLSSG